MSPTARPTCFQISKRVIVILPGESILHRRRGKTTTSSKLHDPNLPTITAAISLWFFLETSQNISSVKHQQYEYGLEGITKIV